ncbi:MAG: hypothetical protein LH471_04430 [Salinibacterium sp.]|nr:hypothetical protein [Salinibacterium sp.]
MSWQLWSVVPVWVAVLVGAVAVALVGVGNDYLIWLPLVFAGAVLVTFGIQLATGRIEGFVTRAMASIGGALLILALATGVIALLG